VASAGVVAGALDAAGALDVAGEAFSVAAFSESALTAFGESAGFASEPPHATAIAARAQRTISFFIVVASRGALFCRQAPLRQGHRAEKVDARCDFLSDAIQQVYKNMS